MIREEDAKEQLLDSVRESYDSDDIELYKSTTTNKKQSFIQDRSIILTIGLIISFISNLALLVAYCRARSQIHLCPSEYSGLGMTTKATYWQQTKYADPNRTISDSAWEAIDTTPNQIALDKEYTKKHGLPDSIPFPWDQSKGLYIVKAFHHMHCLKNIRHAFNEALESHPGQKQFIPSDHIYHCLDALRQDVMCRPDDTPMPTTQERHKIGHGQERKCKDWNALIAWTQAPKQNACFKMFNDYRQMHTLEQFAFCKEDSPYKSKMDDYFREHGHKPLYLDEDPELKGKPGY